MRVRIPPGRFPSASPRQARRPHALHGFDGQRGFGAFDDYAQRKGYKGFGEFLGAQVNDYAGAQGYKGFGELTRALAALESPPSAHGMDPRLDGLWDVVKGGVKAVGKGVATVGKGIGQGAAAVGKGVAAGAKWTAGAVVDAVEFIGNILPSPADYDPERLIVIGLTDPVKFNILLGAATLVIPGLGTAYVLGFTLPQAIATGLPAAVGTSYARGGWERVTTKILDPIVDDLGDKAQFVIDFALNGNSALARWAVKRLARKLPESVIKGILLAVAESVAIVDAVRKPATLKEESTFVSLSEVMKRIAASGVVGTGGFAQSLVSVAGVIYTLAPSISLILKQGGTGVKAAIDTAAKRLIGFGPSDLQGLSDGAKREFVKAKLALSSVSNISIAGSVGKALSDIATALNKLPWGVGGILSGALGNIRAMADGVAGFHAEAKAFAQSTSSSLPTGDTTVALPPASEQPAAVNTAPSVPSTSPAPTPTTTNVAAPQQRLPVAPARVTAATVTPAVLGAGVGMVIGGPVLAAVGAGAGLIYSAVKKG